MQQPRRHSDRRAPVWAWVTIAVLAVAAIGLATALMLVVSSSSAPDDGSTRLERTTEPPPRLTTTTTPPPTTTTTAPTTTTTTEPPTTTTTTTTTTAPPTTTPPPTSTTAPLPSKPTSNPGAGFEWGRIGPFTSDRECEGNRTAWPAETEACFADGAEHFFWGVRQAG